MAVRLAVVCLLLLSVGCGSDDGSTIPSFPVPQWGRGRADIANSGFALTGITNSGAASCDSPGVTCVDLNTNRPTLDPIRTTPAIGLNGNIFVTTKSGAVVAYSPELDQELWRVVPGVNGVPLGEIRSSPALAADNNVFYGTDTGWVVSLSFAGGVLWTRDVNPIPTATNPALAKTAIVGSPLLLPDSFDNAVQAAFVGTTDGRVLALDGLNGQIRWQVQTSGAIEGDLVFDGLTLYGSSASGFLHSLTQRGTEAFPPVSLGAVASPFTASLSLLGTTLAQPGLKGSGGSGRVRGFTLSGIAPIWESSYDAPVMASPGQFRHAITLASTTGQPEAQIAVTEYLVVDAGGTGWLIDPQIGSPGTRCIGGPDDQRPCFVPSSDPWMDNDCQKAAGAVVPCEPLHQCVGGEQAGLLCRTDEAEDCPEGRCEAITTCASGSKTGLPCNHDGQCEGGTCNLSIFSVAGPVVAPPTTSADATILVATAPDAGPGVLYAIEPPGLSEPTESLNCEDIEFCRFAFTAKAAIRAAPSINQEGFIYFGDDSGTLYLIRGN